MVSTRQMSTTGSCHGGSGSGDECGPTTSRLSVTTRHQSNALAAIARGSSAGGHSSSRIQIDDDGKISQQPQQQQQQQQQQRIFLLDLPLEILDKIFSYVGYKKVGQVRVVSKKMNQVCSGILNSTFTKLQTQILNRFQTVKAKMPRRESARRNHPLAFECDIIETCYMRLSLLQMTFGKHIERKYCCFFPGGILDEVYDVLNYIRTSPKLERPYKVTDELFDLSTMAMEYFKEHIEPNLPDIAYFSKDFFDLSAKSKQSYTLKTVSELTESSSPSPPQSNMVLRKGIRKIKQGMKMYNNQLAVLRSELRYCKRKSTEQGKQIAEQQKLLADQQKQTLEYANRLDENDKKNEEMARKFSTLLQELNKCKTELQYWRSKSPAVQVCTSCGMKISPITQEDYLTTFVNQSVKSENINIDIDDVDDSSDTSNTFSNSILDNRTNTEFVYPDETTTAKLLAAHQPVRNLKRYHEETVTSSNSSIFATTDVSATTTTTTTTTDLSLGLQTNLKAPPPNFTTGNYAGIAGGGSSISNNNGAHHNGSNGSGGGGSNGFGVGVETRQQQQLLAAAAANDLKPSTSTCTVTSAAAGGASSLATIAADVTSLSSVSSETKKARRVQSKGSRCNNLSSKRNK